MDDLEEPDLRVPGRVIDIVSTIEYPEGHPILGEEDTLSIEINGIRGEFFFYDGEALHKYVKERKGKTILVKPALFICTPRRLPKKRKSFENNPGPGAGWRAIVRGPITKIYRVSNKITEVVVDCGFPILVENADTAGAQALHDLKEGDYVEAEGRPDIAVHPE